MSTHAKSIPEGFHSVTPYLTVKGAAQAIDFYKRAFGAQERYRLPLPDGRVGHAEIAIGNSIVMLADEFPEFENQSPQSLHGSTAAFALYVENVDLIYDRAIAAGATSKEPIKDQFWGDRVGTILDPFGHKWMLMTHVEDVPPDEIMKRMNQICAQVGSEKK